MKSTIAQLAAFARRPVKRAAPVKAESRAGKAKKTWAWSRGTTRPYMLGGFVDAHTKSEARALVKAAAGVSKHRPLPADVHLQPVVRMKEAATA